MTPWMIAIRNLCKSYVPPEDDGLRLCKVCDQLLPLEHYYLKSNGDRHSTSCKACSAKDRTFGKACEAAGVPESTARNRVARGMTLEEALHVPLKATGNKLDHIDGVPIREICLSHGVSNGTYRYRLSLGWTKMDAATTPPKGKR